MKVTTSNVILPPVVSALPGARARAARYRPALLAACSSVAFFVALERPASAQTAFTVTNTASLNQAITQIDKGTAGQSFTINIANGFTIGDGSGIKLLAINTAGNVTINGNSTTLDGGGAQRGLFVFAGNVTINNLTIQNTLAQGGSGGASGSSGGGGDGAIGRHGRARCGDAVLDA